MNTKIEKEILNNFENPIDTLTLYHNIHQLSNKSDVIITSMLENTDGFIRSSINQLTERFTVNYHNFSKISREEKNKYFVSDDLFHNLLRVVVFESNKSFNTRKIESSIFIKQYCLFFKGYRIEDSYLQSILPEDKVEHSSYYNDSTKMERLDMRSFYLSLLETERFLEKYDKKTHCEYLFNEK